jgi:hypothetical protein
MQQSASQCYRWLKALTFTPFQGLVSSSLNKLLPTTCITESLELIRDHWRRVWRRPELNFDAEFNAVDAEIDALPNPHCHLKPSYPLLTFAPFVKMPTNFQNIGVVPRKCTSPRAPMPGT